MSETQHEAQAAMHAQVEAMPKMMFSIDGKEYDALMGLAKVSLNTLYELKTKTGIGMQTLMGMAKKMQAFKDPNEILEDKDAFQAFRIIIWLARKHAGEDLSIAQANDFPITDLLLIGEPEDEEAPKVTPPGSAPAGDAPGVESTSAGT